MTEAALAERLDEIEANGEHYEGRVRTMGPTTGDDVISWDTKDRKSVNDAWKQFEKAKKQGLQAFRVEHHKGEQMDEFDPAAGEILFAPAMAGG